MFLLCLSFAFLLVNCRTVTEDIYIAKPFSNDSVFWGLLSDFISQSWYWHRSTICMFRAWKVQCSVSRYMYTRLLICCAVFKFRPCYYSDKGIQMQEGWIIFLTLMWISFVLPYPIEWKNLRSQEKSDINAKSMRVLTICWFILRVEEFEISLMNVTMELAILTCSVSSFWKMDTGASSSCIVDYIVAG